MNVCSSAVCVQSEWSRVQDNLICGRCLSKNNHDVMRGLSHWLEGVSRGGAHSVDKARCPEDSESRGGLWDEVMQKQSAGAGQQMITYVFEYLVTRSSVKAAE